MDLVNYGFLDPKSCIVQCTRWVRVRTYSKLVAKLSQPKFLDKAGLTLKLHVIFGVVHQLESTLEGSLFQHKINILPLKFAMCHSHICQDPLKSHVETTFWHTQR